MNSDNANPIGIDQARIYTDLSDGDVSRIKGRGIAASIPAVQAVAAWTLAMG